MIMEKLNNLYRNDKLGCLYNWNTATDKRDITSGNGWRVPNDKDWDKVKDNEKFKETLKENLGGSSWSGSFYNVANYGNWWSAAEYDSTNAWHRYLHYSMASVSRISNDKANGFSVRLVRDITKGEKPPKEYIGNNGIIYDVIQIGNQLWLAENLRETKFRNGDNIEFSNYKQKEIMNELKIEINVPEGYEAVKTENGYDIVPIKVEKSPDKKLNECRDKIEKYNRDKNYCYYTTGNGFVGIRNDTIYYNHAPQNVIKAEQIQMVWRRLAMMYNEGEEWHDRYSVILVEKDKLEPFNNQSSKTERITFRNIQKLYEAVEEIGEENLIFMLKNL